jgi:hypothetical protein
MFLVRHAREVMGPNVLALPAETSFDSLLREHETQGRFQHVAVIQQDRLAGVIRINTGLWRGLAITKRPVTLGELVTRN